MQRKTNNFNHWQIRPRFFARLLVILGMILGGILSSTSAQATTTATMVKDINVGADPSEPSHLLNVNGTLFFSTTINNNTELWKSDGTESGTVKIKTISPNSSSDADYFINAGGTLFFSTSNGIWKSDGTESGTVKVFPIIGRELTNINGAVFFTAFSGGQWGLWKTDSTSEGTDLVKNTVDPYDLENVNGTLFFNGYSSASGRELWKSDGTTEGTVIVKDINTGSGSSTPYYLTNLNGAVYFSAFDATTQVNALWKSDGTESGTVKIKDVNVNLLTNAGGTLYFDGYVYDETIWHGRAQPGLWKSNGTESGTVLVKNLSTTSEEFADIYGPFVELNGEVLFVANDSSFNHGTTGVEVWKTDGTESGTVVLKDIVTDGGSSYPDMLTKVEDAVFFRADDSIHGTELWKTDGTESGTEMVADIYPDNQNHFPGDLAGVGSTLYFVTEDETHGYELWRTQED